MKKYGPGLVKPALEAALPHLKKAARGVGAHIADRTGLTKLVGKEAVERLRGNGGVSGGVVSGGGWYPGAGIVNLAKRVRIDPQ